MVLIGLASCMVGALAQMGCSGPTKRPDNGVSAATAVSETKLVFNESIAPILSANCYQCHGPDPGSRKAGLRLDRGEFAFAPHEKSGPAILAGDPDHSPLIQRIESTNEKERMPPAELHKIIAPAEIALLRRWINEGAAYQEHWAFIAPARPVVPATAATDVVRDPIDAFITSRLRREGLTPAPEADPRTLIRRVTLDLTGLPPTPDEVAQFLSDTAPGAYERLVDRLLANPRYGEHRARYWLDYIRYADTHGLHLDNNRAIWPYRDYVIRSFNTNKPFDGFVREQLAGDLLAKPTLDQLVATGFMRCNLTTNEAGAIPEEVFVNQTRDRVETFGVTFLGLTTGCASCHDHKFDPITQRDHYQLAAFLNNTAEDPWDFNVGDAPPVARLPTDETRSAAELLLARRGELQARLEARRAQASKLLQTWLGDGHQPAAVSSEGLEMRLRLDEEKGDVLKNSAPSAATATFKAETNPLIWGEASLFWPSARFDMNTRLSLGDVGNVDAAEPFSAGGWIMLRTVPGGGVKTPRGTGAGTIMARMAGPKDSDGRGWELRTDEARHFIVTLAADPEKSAIQLETKEVYLPGEWLHVFFTYDGSRKAAGVKLYVNGQLAATNNKKNSLGATDSIRTTVPTELGHRGNAEPLREARYQDMRVYRRELSGAEVARLPFEERTAEILARQPDPAKWTGDEAFIAEEKYFLGQVDAEAKNLTAAFASFTDALDALTKGGTPSLIARERPQPAYAHLLKRGNYYSREERVAPAPPHFLPALSPGEPSNRLGLADWLFTPEQPLFARVAVNRMWQEIFGTGLVETTGDFGVMGSRPSHRELLDWLAVEFRESGWDVKKFYRRLVTSATYRQSSRVTPAVLAKDPANRLLARGPRFRMDGEMLRDEALAVSGLLVEKLGGPPVKPWQPPGLWEEVAMLGSDTRQYKPDDGDAQWRRSIYTYWKRSSPPPNMETFDAPSREMACLRRARSNTPLQALVLMNDPQFVEAARKLGERALRAAPALDARLDFMAQAALSRPLETREREILTGSAQAFRAHFAAHPADATALLTVGRVPVDPAISPAELAEWTLVASQFFNLDEFVTK